MGGRVHNEWAIRLRDDPSDMNVLGKPYVAKSYTLFLY
jgi:hypothetical protein